MLSRRSIGFSVLIVVCVDPMASASIAGTAGASMAQVWDREGAYWHTWLKVVNAWQVIGGMCGRLEQPGR
jgi:hypothetical protein